jgi:hypothetical protein
MEDHVNGCAHCALKVAMRVREEVRLAREDGSGTTPDKES